MDERSQRTLAYYNEHARSFWEGTRDHDVSQNYEAFLRAIEQKPPLKILDLGCGPGRDVAWFRSRGHDVVGLDGAASFCEMARALTGCEILEQDFVALDLGTRRFHGIFANASLFHVPTRELPRVLRELHDALEPRGVLFASNPHGPDREGFSGGRFGAFHTLETWRTFVVGAGFEEIEHYYRPTGKPRDEQPWLATVWRRPSAVETRTTTLEEAFAAGMRLFDEGRHWDAHEAWEERWRIETREPQRLFLQALIQIAASFHKRIVMHDDESAARLLEKGLAKLERAIADTRWSSTELGFDAAAFRTRVTTGLR